MSEVRAKERSLRGRPDTLRNPVVDNVSQCTFCGPYDIGIEYHMKYQDHCVRFDRRAYLSDIALPKDERLEAGTRQEEENPEKEGNEESDEEHELLSGLITANILDPTVALSTGELAFGTSVPSSGFHFGGDHYRGSPAAFRSSLAKGGFGFGSPASYKTAQTSISIYATAPRSIPKFGNLAQSATVDNPKISKGKSSKNTRYASPSGEVFSSEWLEYLRSRGVLLDPAKELDWSGRGQHVEYEPWEGGNIPLKAEKILGHSATAVVESVMCRRIRLARKQIRCSRSLSKEDAIVEVEHLNRVHNRHILRVVGTYTLRRDLFILLYPVCEWNLEEFMDDIVENSPRNEDPSSVLDDELHANIRK